MRTARLVVALLSATALGSSQVLAQGIISTPGIGLTSPMTAATPFVATGGTSGRSPADRAADFVRPEDFKLAADPDDTLSLQRAANTGRTVRLRDDKTYTVCASIAGTKFIGEGRGASMVLCGGWIMPVAEYGHSFIHNPNWTASSITDTDAVVENIYFDGTGSTNNGTFKAVMFRMMQRVTVRGTKCHQVGDCTAFQADVDTMVDNSWADSVGNVGFDHWDGPRNGTVQNSTVICGNNGAGTNGIGIMFTATSTALATRAGANMTSRGNRVFGTCLVGITANVLSSGSTLTNIVSDGDFVDIQGTSGEAGILFQGAITGGRINKPVVVNSNGGVLVGTKSEVNGATYEPSKIDIVDVTIDDPIVSSGNVAPIVAIGKNIRVVNARVRASTTPTYSNAVWVDDATAQVDGCFDTGTAAVFSVGGTTPQLINRCPAALQRNWSNIYDNNSGITVNSTGLTFMLQNPGIGSNTIPAGSVVAGRAIHFQFWARYTTPASNTAGLNFQLNIGPAVAANVTTATMPSSITNGLMDGVVDCNINTIGAGNGTSLCSGRINYSTGTGTSVTTAEIYRVSVNLDTTVSNSIAPYMSWSSAVTTQSLVVVMAMIDLRN